MQMEQFESVRMQNLKDTYKVKAPMLWDLLSHLLNPNGRTHKTWAAFQALSTPMKVTSAHNDIELARRDNPMGNDENEGLPLYEIVCETCCSTNKCILTTFRKESLLRRF